MSDIQAIDVVTNLYTEEIVKMRPKWYQRFYTGKFGMESAMLKGLTLEAMVEKMDRAGIEIGLLIANNVTRPAAVASTLVVRLCTLWFAVLVGFIAFGAYSISSAPPKQYKLRNRIFNAIKGGK